VSEKLRIVHPDIVGEDKQPCDERQDRENGVPCANFHLPERGEYACADNGQRQQRYDPPGDNVVAGELPENAHEIK